MGLNVSVGRKDPPDDWFQEINAVLIANGLPTHTEPPNLPPEKRYAERIGPYDRLHCLRRLAAHLQVGRGRPPPLAPGDSPTKDPILVAHDESSPLASKCSRFAHLLCHDDSAGFYVPIDFKSVLVDEAGYFGSSFALRRECEDLASELELPLGMAGDPGLTLYRGSRLRRFLSLRNLQFERDVKRSGAYVYRSDRGPRDPVWFAYARESYVCLVLHRAAMTSIETGAAIRFQ